jgi:hypothetical protein
MKFKDLKKKKFIIHFDWFYNNDGEHYGTIICQNEELYGMAEWEYDNGLYTESGYYDLNLTWKDIKHNLSHYKLRHQKEHRKPYYIWIYEGKCRKCGKPISFKEWKENDTWCENCQDDYWMKEAEKYEEEYE